MLSKYRVLPILLFILTMSLNLVAAREKITDNLESIDPQNIFDDSAINNRHFTSYQTFEGNEWFLYLTNDGQIGANTVAGRSGGVWPRGTDKSIIYNSGLWVGAIVGGEIRVSTVTYGSAFSPGTINSSGIAADFNNDIYRLYKVNRWSDPGESDWVDWPDSIGAPISNSDPYIPLDQTLYTVYNDLDPGGNYSIYTTPLGAEVRQTIIGGATTANDGLDKTFYIQYKIFNRSSDTWENTKFSFWLDPDLGDANNDLAGYDRLSRTGFCYNDISDPEFGIPPAIGCQLISDTLVLDVSAFSVMSLSHPDDMYFDPNDPETAYNRQLGLSYSGSPIIDPTTSATTTYMHKGEPENGNGWNDDFPDDKRFMLTVQANNVDYNPGDSLEIVIAVTIGQGYDNLNSLAVMKQAAWEARIHWIDGFTGLTMIDRPILGGESFLYSMAIPSTVPEGQSQGYIELYNHGNLTLSASSSFSDGQYYSISPTNFNIDPGSSEYLTVTFEAPAIPMSVHQVPGDYPTIQAAVDASISNLFGTTLELISDDFLAGQADNFGLDTWVEYGGDTIRVAPGFYSENIEVIGKTIHLKASGDVNNAIIDGTLARVLYFNNSNGSSIIGFTIQNGNTDGYGGGVYADNSDLKQISGNVFKNNVAAYGGGLFAIPFSGEMIGNRFENNYADGMGGGFYLSQTDGSQIHHNVFSSNSTDGYGGAGRLSVGGTFFYNNTLWGNVALGGGSGLAVRTPDHYLVNNIIWNGNNQGLHSSSGSEISAEYCIVDSGWPGEGNLDIDPNLVDPANGDFSLAPFSPAIDGGHPDLNQNGFDWAIDPADQDPDGTQLDIGAIYHHYNPGVSVTFIANTCGVPDTLNENSTIQIRGGIGLLGSWSNNSQVFMDNIGGDYWSTTVFIDSVTAASQVIEYKYCTDPRQRQDLDPGWQGWEGGNNWELDLSSFSGSDTILDLGYVRGWTNEDAGVIPYISTDSIDVYFRVNMQAAIENALFDAGTQIVGVRGSNTADWQPTGDLSWSESVELTQEADHVDGMSTYDGSNFWAGRARIPIDWAGAELHYKFVYHAPGDNNDVEWETGDNRPIYLPVTGDTTVHWVWWDDEAPYGGTGNQQTLHVATWGDDNTGDGSDGNPFLTIQHGIDVANEGDIILVHQGTYYENINYYGKNITVASNYIYSGEWSNVEQTIIDGNQQASVVFFNNGENEAAILDGFTIVNGYSQFGGGIQVRSCNPTLKNLIVENNSAWQYGGGIHLYNSSAYVNNNFVSDNTAGIEGGGLNVYISSGSVIENMLIQNNIAPRGSGVKFDNSSAEIINSNISDNQASDYGGGILVHSNSDISIYDSQITNNQADSLGGGIYIDSSNIYLFGGSVDANTALSGGGIMVGNNSTLTFDNLQVTHNHVESYEGGGGIISSNSDLYIYNSLFFQNTAPNGWSAAIDFSNNDTNSPRYCQINNTNFESNNAFSCAGLSPWTSIDDASIEVSLIGCSFTNNYAVNRTVLYATGTNTVVNIDDCTFDGNQAEQYTSGVQYAGNARGIIKGSVFSNNISSTGDASYSTSGLGVWTGSEVDIINCTIVNNQAGYGGGLSTGGNVTVNMYNTILWNNSPSQVSFQEWNGDSIPEVNIAYCDLDNGFDGLEYINASPNLNWLEGNLEEDPQFTNPDNNEYDLQASSPCIDTGHPDLDGDGETWENDPDDQDPDGTRMDMGALYFNYEVSDLSTPVWQTSFGGSGSELGMAVDACRDGGFIMAGISNSFEGNYDGWLIKTDSNGAELWNQYIGGDSTDYIYDIKEASNGDFLVVGYSNSWTTYEYDLWVVRTDSAGNELWNITIGGEQTDRGYSIAETADGGIIIQGTTNSYGSGEQDIWLIKTDQAGNQEWDLTFGGELSESSNSLAVTSDGGYFIVGSSNSWSGGDDDLYAIKTNSDGTIEWSNVFDTELASWRFKAVATSSGEYLITGWIQTESNELDAWIIKLDISGNEIWRTIYGGPDHDRCYGIIEDFDGSYVISGYSRSRNLNDYDIWLFKIAEDGNQIWNKYYGSDQYDAGRDLCQAANGDYIIAGFSDSFGDGSYDYYLMRAYSDQTSSGAINVATWGNDGTGDGSESNPYATIQHGIDQANDGDMVLVQQGTYYENINYNGKNIIVASNYVHSGDWSDVENTIIDGNQSSSVVTFENGESDSAILQGFTIENGQSYAGGGVYCNNSSPIISHCRLVNNSVDNAGGGISGWANSYLTLNDCVISDNHAGNSGGGLHADNSNLMTINSVFSNNTSGDNGGGLALWSSSSNSIALDYCIIKNNSANDAGGGIYIEGSSDIIISNCRLNNNNSQWGAGIFDNGSGAHMYVDYVSVTDNIASGEAGGMFLIGTSGIFYNLTIVNNTSSSGGGFKLGASCNIDLVNSVTWFNNPESIMFDPEGYPSTITINYSNIQGGLSNINNANNSTIYWGLGNISGDPLFIDYGTADYNLQIGSPCIDSGHPDLDGDGYNWEVDPDDQDPDGTRMDMGAYYYSQDSTGYHITTASINPGPNSWLAQADTIWIDFSNPVNHGIVETRCQLTSVNYGDFAYHIGQASDLLHYLVPDESYPFNDLIVLNTSPGIVDEQNNPVDISAINYVEFHTNLPADFTGDNVINYQDFSTFTDLWHTDDEMLINRFDLFPYQGEPPDILVSPDGQFGYDELMVLVYMWNWSHQQNGRLARTNIEFMGEPPTFKQAGSELLITMPETAEVGQLIISYQPETAQVKKAPTGHSAERLVLHTENTELGELLIEYVNLKNNPDNLITLNAQALKRSNFTVQIEYSFLSSESHLIGQGQQQLDLVAIPDQFSLHQNYPNPFNPVTTIEYDLPDEGLVRLVVVDILGRQVVQLINEHQEAGYKSVRWTGRNSSGKSVSTGLYFYLLESGQNSAIRKLVILK